MEVVSNSIVNWIQFLWLNFIFYQLVDISADGYLSLMMESGDLREDIKLPDGDLGNDIKSRFENNEDILVSVNFFLVMLVKR